MVVDLRQFLAFRVDGRRYAVPAQDVAEVLAVPAIARLPHSPASLMGLANIRGTVVPVVSPAALLGRDVFTPGPAARAIVLTNGLLVAWAVDAVESLVSINASRIEIGQAELTAEPGEILLGAFQQDAGHEVTKILDAAALHDAAFGDRRGLGDRDRSAEKPRVSAAPDVPDKAAEPSAQIERRLLISFEVSGQEYALPLEAVREVIALPDSISVVPRAEAVLLGVTAWRDTLLPLLSLRALLGFPPLEAWTGREKVIVAAVNGAQIGLVADRARSLVRADAASIDPAPAMLSARSGGESKITAMFRGDGGRRLISLLSPESLFREDVMRRIDQAVSIPIPTAAEPARSTTVRFLVFSLGDEEFGLPIEAVDEVARVPTELTRVPKMPRFLEGVVNLRGEVLPVVDQRRRFDMPRFEGTGQRLIVVRAERHRAGLIVDSVSEVLRTQSSAIEAPPDFTSQGTRLVNGVINAGNGERMILLLDPTELLTGSERRDLDQLEFDDDASNGPSGPDEREPASGPRASAGPDSL